MTTQNHTPGQWTYKATAGNHDFIVYPEDTGRDIAIVRDFNEDNARLIAAAPDLMAACVDLVQLWDSWAEHSTQLAEPLRRSIEMRVDQARAAIELTKG